MSNTINKEVEVNGKIYLGPRRLVVSHVENACTFYAYQETDKGAINDIKVVVAAECSDLPRLSEFPKLETLYGVLYSGDKQWYRGKVEQIDQGTDKKQVRVRMVDFGWNDVVEVSTMCQLPQEIAGIKIRCEKYKMADMKPKGRNEGYTAVDRQKGADWLEKTIRGRIVVADCHRLVKYVGGIQADCMVGTINLNQAAIKQGHVIKVKDNVQGGGGRGAYNNLFNQRNNYNNMDRGQRVGRPGNPGMGMDCAANNGMGHVKFGRGGGQVMNGRGGGVIGNQVKPPKMIKQVEDEETINKLEKTTSLDQAINGVASLLDKVSDGRKNAPEKSGLSISKTLSSLVGVAATVEEAVCVIDSLKCGVEAVEAAAQLVTQGEKGGVEDKGGDALKVEELQARTNLSRCINKYMGEYSHNEEAVSDAIQRVDSQLSGMTATIPASWKLLAVRADKVTKENLLEVAGNVKNWLETAATNETVLAVTSNKQINNLTKSLTQLAEGIKARQEGNKKAEIPTNIDVIFLSTKAALTAEISSSGPSSIKPKEKNNNKEGNESSVVRSAWRALTALKSQLEMVKKKNVEYGNMLTALEPRLAK